LKGERERQETGVMEIINIGGTITLSTNVAGSRYKYEWRYMNGATDDGLLLPGGVYDSDSKFKSEGMTLNGSGIRDISRVLKISTTTVMNCIKKKKNI